MISLNAVVAKPGLSDEMSAMVKRHLTDHLMTWCVSIPGASFQIRTRRNFVYLSTNSAELFGLYLHYEQPYVAYLLSPDAIINEMPVTWSPERAA
jgi:hypothetical protein